MRFFPVDNFMTGPSVTWAGTFYDEVNVNSFGLGANIGGAFSVRDKLFHMFFLVVI